MRAKYLPFVLLGLIVGLPGALVAGGGGSRRAEPPASSKGLGRVRLVLMSDTNDATLGPAFRLSAHLMSATFKQANALDPRRPYDTPVLLQGDRVSERNLLSAINGLSVRPGVDTVVIFCWAHGASDARRKHYFDLANKEKVSRSKVVAAAKARRPRLLVVLSDSCNYAQPGTPSDEGEEEARVNWQALRTLFLEHEGVCDINACRPGQFSWYVFGRDRQGAGLFTAAFVDHLYSDKAKKLVGPRGVVDWPTLLRVVGEETNRLFVEHQIANHPHAKKINQRSQDPFAYSWPSRSSGPRNNEAPVTRMRPPRGMGLPKVPPPEDDNDPPVPRSMGMRGGTGMRVPKVPPPEGDNDAPVTRMRASKGKRLPKSPPPEDDLTLTAAEVKEYRKILNRLKGKEKSEFQGWWSEATNREKREYLKGSR